MKHIFLAIYLLMISGCASAPAPETDGNGYFHLSNEPIAVTPPSDCIPEISYTESERAVDFHLGKGFWRVFGLYSLQVFDIPQEIHDTESFYSQVREFAPGYIENDRKRLGLEFDFKKGEILERALPTYRALGESSEADFVATFALHENSISVASLVFLHESGKDRGKALSCYEAFEKSVHEVEIR